MKLPKAKLGDSGIEATELCFGTLTLCPLQADLSPAEGGALIRRAVEEGITFIDTAEGYRCYDHMREGISSFDREDLVIATKSHAKTADAMQESFEKACREMDTEYIDIFHLHLISSPEDFEQRKGPLDTLKKLRSKGLVKAIGITVHSIEPCRHIMDNPDIDICYPSFNKGGFGINDGTVEEMADVLSKVHETGKGIYAMKPLGGGHLIEDVEGALDFVRSFEFMDAVSVGMKDERELAFNCAYFRGEEITEEMRQSVEKVKRELMINRMCRKCGHCVEVCEQDALTLGEDKAMVDTEKCIMCGYCAPECPAFAIRIV